MTVKDTGDISNLPAGTLVLSGGKIMPMVTPMQPLTSNIIVNAQTRPSNPIILNNTQQGQMIVVQPLQTNHFQTVTAVQTMTLNTVPNIQTNMIINPQDWAQNVKTIINSSKIGGLKGILPKVREVTETTMTYKVPIPAIHKDKCDSKNEVKGVSSHEKHMKNKSSGKATKSNKSFNADKNVKEVVKNDNTSKAKSSVNKQILKRNLNGSSKPFEIKKRKIKLNENETENAQIKKNIILDNTVTCKSIENLKQVIEKIGDDTSFAKLQSNNSSINSSTEEEKRNDNNLLSETSDTSLPIVKHQEENLNALHEFSEDQKSSDIIVSNASNVSSDNEVSNILNIANQPQAQFPENVSNEKSKNITEDPLILAKNSTESQTNEYQSASDKGIIQLPNVECNIDESVILQSETNEDCNIETGHDNILQSNSQNQIIDEQMPQENNKIFLNLDTNTTTMMKLEASENKIDPVPPISTSPSIKVLPEEDSPKLNTTKEDQNLLKAISYSPSNSFVPINHKTDSLHSDLSNDIFASLQVPSSSNNSESISPTAAFLMAFPIVSSLSGKTEVLDDEMKDDFKYTSQTPPMLLQIGTMEPNSFKINSRASENDNLGTVQTPEINEQSPTKPVSETTTPVTTSVTTPVKALPRVISSQTLTESYKIIPASSEAMNRQLSIESNNSLQLQTNSSTGTATSTIDTLTRDQSSMVANNIDRPMNNNVQNNYVLENKPQPNFNYTKDMPLSSISSSMANDILNKYISTTSLSTIVTESSSKYNTSSHFVPQHCQTSVSSNCVKENVDRNSSQFNFTCPSTNDIPTERDLCKLQICPMESFTERSNEYSAQNKETPFTNSSVQTNTESPNKNVQVSISPEKNPKITMQVNQNMHSNNNFHLIKRLDNKVSTSNNSETNNLYPKKTNEISNSSSYVNICDNKINKKLMTTSSQPSSSGQKDVSTRSNTYSGQTETYIASTTFEENNITRSTTTVANSTSSFSILSWTTFSPLSSNNSNFPQYEQTPISTEIPKTISENFNYLPMSKENTSLSNTLPQPSYSTVDTHVPTYDKSKAKLPLDTQKRSPYHDLNKSRNMRLSQSVPVQKSTRTHNQTAVSNTDYKYPTENKNKYKYPMDMDYVQNNYSGGVDVLPHMQHHQQPQHQQSQQTHQTSNSKNSNQPLQSLKSDKSNYILPDYNTHTNFNSDTTNIQPRYSNNHDTYVPTTFKYGEKNQQIHSKYQSSSQGSTTTLHQDNSLYNNKHVVPQQQQQQQQQHQPQSNQTKPKTETSNQIQPPQQQQQQVHQQHAMRPPVNWMMTPEIKHNSNITDIILPPIGKELEFCQNNIFSQTPSYNQTGANHQFYNNYDMSAHHSFPNIPVLQSEPKRNIDTTYYPEEQAFSWSPTKNLSQTMEQNQSLKSMESSSMSTLVGDLALSSSNATDKQNFLFGQIPIRSGGTNDPNKDSLKNKEPTVSNRDYQGIVNNPQNAQQQHSSHNMPFLSVSQLVDHEKVEKTQHQQSHNTITHHHGNHHHHHHQPQQQPQPQQQQTPSRKQRKSNSNSPRASVKRQMEIRQKQSASHNTDQIHRQHEEPKTNSSTSSFTDNSYQPQPHQQQQHPQQQQPQQQPQQQQQQQPQQKFNQPNNDVQWRSRNCKSNYTAEALIGSNNNHTDSSHSDKNLPKYSASYTQNKFSSSLSSDPMSINYFPNVEDASSSYGQVMNQNFNHSYTYSSNANIYPSSNFITNISNSSTNYMMSLHENTTDYLEGNNFLLPPNVSTTSITTPLLTNMTDGAKNHHHHHPHHHHHHHHQPYAPSSSSTSGSKHQNCDKRLYFNQQKKSKRKTETSSTTSTTTTAMQNFDFPLSGITSPLDDYHHASTFLPPPNPLYQNQPNVYSKSTLPPPPPPPPPPVSSASAPPPPPPPTSTAPSTTMPMTQQQQQQQQQQQHHPSGTSLTNFNLSTIFPEINDKVGVVFFK